MQARAVEQHAVAEQHVVALTRREQRVAMRGFAVQICDIEYIAYWLRPKFDQGRAFAGAEPRVVRAARDHRFTAEDRGVHGALRQTRSEQIRQSEPGGIENEEIGQCALRQTLIVLEARAGTCRPIARLAERRETYDVE